MHAFTVNKNHSPSNSVYEFDEGEGFVSEPRSHLTPPPTTMPAASASAHRPTTDLMSQTGVRLFKPIVERFVLPAMRLSHPLHQVKTDDTATALRQLQAHYQIPAGMDAELATLITHDGARLDTLTVAPAGFHAQEPQERHYIVRFNGNGSLFEDTLATMVAHAQRLKQGIVSFNYRGVGRSSPKPSRSADLVHDGIAEVGALLKAGVPASHITLHGYSLGGGVATYVAAYFYKQGLTVKLFNDRSFASMAEVAQASLGLLGSFASRLLVNAGWELNSYAHYQILPDDAKMAINTRGDRVIPRAVSLSYASQARGGNNDPTTRFFIGTHDAALSEISGEPGSLGAEELFFAFAQRGITK